ncbi:MAG: GspE/PulE family protein, partial [Candidatus Omnitrophica bacterium]|nr:GspE/PulE family protein [Candidatus Omnitrophota bacterium]
LEIFQSSPAEIEEVINKVYAKKDVTKDLLDGLGAKMVPSAKDAFAAEGSSIIKLVDLIIAQAVRDRASDIHIEPEEGITRIRFRIDGILHEIPSPPKDWEMAIISRVKVLSGMDIAEARVPQDGHFQAKVDERVIDFRVSTMPTIHGENVVMRLLDTASVMIGLERLGFSTYEQMKRYEDIIARPFGVILSTGPTGSGKTTTLYSALMRINTIERNIITIEDPVEYRLGLIRQIQVNAKAGITFANGLRAILRQDPDVIMVGEIRDLETAIIAVQAALTGHLVFSTLHTNDAPSSVTRLINMGVEPFLIAACLIGVMAQRLIRLICNDCKEAYEPSQAIIDKWGLKDKGKITLYRGRGCDSCMGTGYKGRSGIFELMVIDDEMREMIISNASVVALRTKAQEKGMRFLRDDGLDKVLKGMTSIEEVARVTEEHIDIKHAAEAEKVQPMVKPIGGAATEAPAAAPVTVDTSELEEYQKRIASWLSRKE